MNGPLLRLAVCSTSLRKTHFDLESKIIVKRPQGCFIQTLNIGCMIILVVGIIVFIGTAVVVYDMNKKKHHKKEFNKEKIDTINENN